MRSDVMRTAVAVVALAALSFAGVAGAQDKLNIPPVDATLLPNGLTIQFLRLPTVPMVTFEMWMPAGSVADPDGKEGLANLTAELLRKGAGTRDATAFAQAVDRLGADFATSVNPDRTRIRLNLLTKDFDEGLGLFTDAILKPRFESGEVKKLQKQLAEGVVQAKDNPRNVIGDYHAAFLYGSHPYGKPVEGTETSLPKIAQQDVLLFVKNFYGPEGSVLTVAGDFDPVAAKQKVTSAFNEWPKALSGMPTLAEPTQPPATRVLLVNKNDTPQTWFIIGNLGPAMDDPDFAAVELVRTVFGGRFTSWLNTKLRIESGLTYGARYNITRRRVAGTAAISSFTATETTKQALDLALAQLDRLHTDGLSAAELASAKAYFKGQTPYDYETAADLATAMCELSFYGLDRSRLDDLFQKVDAVTLDDCKRVIGEYFKKDKLVFTTIGVADSVKTVLEAYGPVRVRENSDPGFK